MIELKLFITFFKIGLFSFGGGYAMLPLIQHEVIYKNHWITQEAFSNLLGISQSTPGPIAINASTYIGYTTAGFSGAIAASLGVVAPSIIIISIFSFLLNKLRGNSYIEAIMKAIKLLAIGFIFAAGLMLHQNVSESIEAFVIFIIVFLCSYFLKADPILMIVLSGIAGYLFL